MQQSLLTSGQEFIYKKTLNSGRIHLYICTVATDVRAKNPPGDTAEIQGLTL
jgi:hypothetical protein